MEEHKEKRRKVCERKRTQSRSASSFPQDLTSEILLRLPEKSVARFRCVSKLWLSISTDPYFINLFETRSPRPSLLLCFRERDKLFVSSIPQHQTLRNSKTSCSQPLDHYHMKLSKEYGNLSWQTESVHGLICFQKENTPIVWNPSTRQFLPLTKPRMSWELLSVFLGYDPIEGKHKVMCIPLSRSSDVCRVLTLGSAQEHWRTVKTKHKHRSDFPRSGRCIKGVVYYTAYVYHRRVWVLMRFDVRSENFGMIDLPSDIFRDILIEYEGRLACVDKTVENKLWILEDAEEHKWSSKDFLEPYCRYDPSLRISFLLKGFTHAGELIYVPSTFDKSYYIVFCDPVKRSFRRFELEGIADEESRPSKGLKTGILYGLHTFPNHIHSLMSLQ